MYRRSQSRIDFELSVADLRKSISVAAWKATPQVSLAQLSAGVTVLAFSSYQEYVQNVLSTWINRCELQAIPSGCLPSSLRAFCFADQTLINSISQYAISSDEFRLLRSLSADFNHPRHLFITGGPLSNGSINQSSLLNKSYPSPKNLQKLFRRIGIDSIDTAMNSYRKANLWETVVSVNDIRTACAHSYTIPISNRIDLMDYLSNLVRIVKTLDRILFQHIVAHTGQPSWPS